MQMGLPSEEEFPEELWWKMENAKYQPLQAFPIIAGERH